MTTATEAAAAAAPDSLQGITQILVPEPRRGSSLGTRLFVAIAGLLAGGLGIATAYAAWQANREADRGSRERLAAAPAIYQGYMDTRREAVRLPLDSLAAEVGTRALLGSDPDVATVHEATRDFATALGAGSVLLFDADGALLARSDRAIGEESGRDFSTISWVATPLTDRHSTTAQILEVRRTRRLSLVAAAPVVQGAGDESRVTGVVAATVPIGEAEAAGLARLLDGEVAFLGNVAKRGAPVELANLGATGDFRGNALPAALREVAGAAAALFDRGEPFGPFEIAVAGETFLGTALPILSGSGEPIAAMVAGRSKRRELAVSRRFERAVLVAGGVLLLVALPITLVYARKLARPIEEVAAAADAVRQGRLGVTLPQGGGVEVGKLSRAFEALVGEMRAKQDLEKLLGSLRASTSGAEPAVGGPAAADQPQAGVVFAHRYETIELLGKGGMGNVWKVRDLQLDEVVALKVLALDFEDAETRGMQRLRQEIKNARAITHPNVVRVHDLGSAGSTRFLTMELVPGVTLRRILTQRHHLELSPGMQIAKQICRGLGAVHGAGIIHGDIKSENVMVTPTGVAKLMDFGLAEHIGGKRFGGGLALGTPSYMSPEAARGADVDERSDIYSLGIVMFELFTGQLPFTSDQTADLLRLQVYAPPPSPRAVRPELPETLADLISLCLAKSRLERPATAAELDRALMRIRT